MQFYLINIAVHFLSFVISFYALSSVRFDQICNVKKPGQVQLLLLLLALALGYLVAQFMLSISIFNGL